ncbi:MAG: hypothetical protein FJY88_01525 [Candidatus Eisenbacteria bacterium]|nr:hypothetical protein [Candidatus Eisenbacteria bacterium]
MWGGVGMTSVARGFVVACMPLVLIACMAGAQRASFSGPPVLDDRKISWSWTPLEGKDPYFLGNTVLDSLKTLAGPVSGRPLRLLRAMYNGDNVCGVYEGDDRIFIWNALTGVVHATLGAPPDSLLDLDVHPSDQLLVGGMRDGRIAFWNLTVGTTPEVYTGHEGRCRKVRFYGAGNNTRDQRFASGGEDRKLRIWLAPGTPSVAIDAEPVVTLDGTSDGATIATGDGNGVIRIYRFLQNQWTIDRRIDAHQGAVTAIRFCRDHSRMFSADALGNLKGWETRSWKETFDVQLDRIESPVIGVRDPDGALAYALDGEGFFQVFDGEDGKPYRSRDLVREGRAYGRAVGDLGRRVFVGLADGSVRTYRAGFCAPSGTNPECFGGYMVYRSPTPFPEHAVLLRRYGFGDSTWSFVGLERSFVDPDSMIARGGNLDEPLPGPHNGLPFYYSIVDYKLVYLNGSIFDVGNDPESIRAGFFRVEPLGDPTPVEAHPSAWSAPPLLDRVIVVPNPYEAGRVPWDAQLGEHVDFMNLPGRATIKLFTTAGDHLRTLEHGAGAFGESSSRESWDLRNHRGEKVASGVYIYHITTPASKEEAQGYFIVVR